jgi:molybdopterin-biosynthesis enzyme MoeA-like protein
LPGSWSKLKAKGKTIGPKGDHTMAEVREAAERSCEKHPEWIEEAQAIVERRKAASPMPAARRSISSP